MIAFTEAERRLLFGYARKDARYRARQLAVEGYDERRQEMLERALALCEKLNELQRETAPEMYERANLERLNAAGPPARWIEPPALAAAQKAQVGKTFA